MSDEQTDILQEPTQPPAIAPAPPTDQTLPVALVIEQLEAKVAINAKVLAANLVSTAQLALSQGREKDGSFDKKHVATIASLLELAAHADVLGDKATVRYEKTQKIEKLQAVQ